MLSCSYVLGFLRVDGTPGMSQGEPARAAYWHLLQGNGHPAGDPEPSSVKQCISVALNRWKKTRRVSSETLIGEFLNSLVASVGLGSGGGRLGPGV